MFGKTHTQTKEKENDAQPSQVKWGRDTFFFSAFLTFYINNGVEVSGGVGGRYSIWLADNRKTWKYFSPDVLLIEWKYLWNSSFFVPCQRISGRKKLMLLFWLCACVCGCVCGDWFLCWLTGWLFTRTFFLNENPSKNFSHIFFDKIATEVENAILNQIKDTVKDRTFVASLVL